VYRRRLREARDGAVPPSVGRPHGAGTDLNETVALRAALDELAAVHSAALQVVPADAASAEALAGDFANREHELNEHRRLIGELA
jgi:hypothetical protein